MGRLSRWVTATWKWWNQHWFRVQAIATPVGSLLTTLFLSYNECTGWCLTSQAEAELASRFASVGILIYTASFAVLETGVMLVVLAWKVKEFFDRKAEEDRERIKAERERIEEDRERIKADRERIIAEVRAEGMAEGMAEGRAEGRAEGEARANRAWREWNRRRINAAANNLPFDEPPPRC